MMKESRGGIYLFKVVAPTEEMIRYFKVPLKSQLDIQTVLHSEGTLGLKCIVYKGQKFCCIASKPLTGKAGV